MSNSELYLPRGNAGRPAPDCDEMSRRMLPLAESAVMASSGRATSTEAGSGANRDSPAVPVPVDAITESPEVNRGKGTCGNAGAEGDISIWLLSPGCLRWASSTPFNLGTYDGLGDVLEVLFRGARDGLLAPVGGEGVLDSRLDDGLGWPSRSLFNEECLGTGKSVVVAETVSTLCRWPCNGRRIGKPAFALGGVMDGSNPGEEVSNGFSKETRGLSNDGSLGDAAGAEVGFNKDQSGSMSVNGRPLLVPASSTSSTFERSGDRRSLDLRSRRRRVGLMSRGADCAAAASLAAEASRSYDLLLLVNGRSVNCVW